jgi:hypothetical protein
MLKWHRAHTKRARQSTYRGAETMKRQITIVNTARGTSTKLLLDRETGRLSLRQFRESHQRLSVVGFEKAGDAGEWPLVQIPPESDGEEYKIVRAGTTGRPNRNGEDTMSNAYFVPTEAAEGLVKRLGPPR